MVCFAIKYQLCFFVFLSNNSYEIYINTFQSNHFIFYPLCSYQLQGSKYDPEGEYIRQWLPELARLPTEWIHHPWDAPVSVLKAAGVELGSNYPKPIIEIETARDNLTEAICLMQGKAGAEETNCISEVVVDSSEKGGNTESARFNNPESFREPSIPEVVLNGKPSCITGSSRDQRVPSMQHFSNNLLQNGKRPRISVEDRAPDPNVNACYVNTEALSVQEHEADLCSTAESSSAKKQATSSFSFCVPRACSVSSKGKDSLDCESSEVKQPWKEHVDEE